jgi:hypothetical protein
MNERRRPFDEIFLVTGASLFLKLIKWPAQLLGVSAWRNGAAAPAVLIGKREVREQVSHYEIYVTCTECGGEHPMRVGANLEDGPANKRSVSDAYYGKTQPPQLQAVEGHKVLCIKREERSFSQTSMTYWCL